MSNEEACPGTADVLAGPETATGVTAPAVPAVPPKPALFQKRVTKKGNKQDFPRKGSTVKVNYSGRLEGAEEVFDSTFDKKSKKSNPLVVKAGVGKLIAGWDAALLTMSVGEKAVLTIPPEAAYGAKGKPPVIPPNATLVFEVELVNIMD